MILSRIKKLLTKRPAKASRLRKRVLAREQHTVSRQDISRAALKVLYGLHKAGFEAYLVGGGVRDVLLGKHPKDFDVATDAKPEEVQKLFPRARLIGRRFKLVHVMFGPDVVEVATFRAQNEDAPQTEHGMVLRDNVYGSIEDDAVRRDFTVNALYYNIADFSVIDFVGGLDDLKHRMLRLIGDPETRYREDPVRMLRAARLAAKLQFGIAPETRLPVTTLGQLLHNVSHARLWDECIKLFLTGHAEASFDQLIELHLFPVMFPGVAREWQRQPALEKLFRQAMHNTDSRLQEDKSVNPAFFFAVLLWPVVRQLAAHEEKKGAAPALALQHAMDQALDEQHVVTAIAKRFSLTMREIWLLQWRLTQRTPSRAEKVLALPRFRAGFDLLLLRAEAGEQEVEELAQWWEDFQHGDEEQKQQLLRHVPKAETGPRKRRPRKPRARAAAQH